MQSSCLLHVVVKPTPRWWEPRRRHLLRLRQRLEDEMTPEVPLSWKFCFGSLKVAPADGEGSGSNNAVLGFFFKLPQGSQVPPPPCRGQRTENLATF